MEKASTAENETLNDWKVLFLCTILRFFHGGIVRTSSLFFVEFINIFNVNRQNASIPFALRRLITFASGPFIGYLATYYQFRTVITFGSLCSSIGLIACFGAKDVIFLSIFFGIFVGFGAATTMSLLQELINRHFDKHLSTATGLIAAGSSIGSALLPYITNLMLDYYGLSGTFLILGGLFLHAIPLSLALPVYPKTRNKTPQNVQQMKDNQSELDTNDKAFASHYGIEIIEEKRKTSNSRSLFKLNKNCYTVNESHTTVERPTIKTVSVFSVFLNPVFIILCIIQSSNTTIITMISTIFIDYIMEKGLTSDQGVYAFMVLSAADIMGRVGLGWITDCGFIGAVKFLGVTYILFGLSCLMYIWSNGFIMSVIISAVYGTMLGVVQSYSPKLFKDYIDPKERTMAVASRTVFFAPICISVPFILGYFKDTTKSYDGLMYALAAMALLSSVLTIVVPLIAKRRQKSSDPAH